MFVSGNSILCANTTINKEKTKRGKKFALRKKIECERKVKTSRMKKKLEDFARELVLAKNGNKKESSK